MPAQQNEAPAHLVKMPAQNAAPASTPNACSLAPPTFDGGTRIKSSSAATSGRVFDIQRFSNHDGPGIRTSVFLKGCPLRCLWCHNPEGIPPEPVVGYDPRKCIACGACVALCPRHHSFLDGVHLFDRTNASGCPDCLTAARACLPGSLTVAGRDVTVEEVMDTVRRDIPFYGETGGMTLTGGEPTLQPAFATALAARAKAESIHVCVETCGYCREDTLLALAKHTDLFLFDIKETDPNRHKAYTGVDNAAILSNLRALDAAGHPTILRCPIIPGFNDREDHMDAIARIANGLEHVQGIELMPYHPLGQGKAERFGMTSSAALPAHVMPRRDAEVLCARLRAQTTVSVRVG